MAWSALSVTTPRRRQNDCSISCLAGNHPTDLPEVARSWALQDSAWSLKQYESYRSYPAETQSVHHQSAWVEESQVDRIWASDHCTECNVSQAVVQLAWPLVDKVEEEEASYEFHPRYWPLSSITKLSSWGSRQYLVTASPSVCFLSSIVRGILKRSEVSRSSRVKILSWCLHTLHSLRSVYFGSWTTQMGHRMKLWV